ncbi:MAG: sigma-70 family RNA polymerase sigma factor [Bacteroidota bacterium]|nr:sigma-70 family RNA polymerase sigma factor [Bacteroidota bacterium]MDP4213152.1 sigma-70 family RNA polymerase sigma factor [Bacteroidota bacterium]MDP4250704.1 sigma-70 family RNA polymerase sigma factor [Bacteroidota bacterium]
MTGPLHNSLTDKELLRHFYADHDNQWLGLLLERYTLLLYGVSMKYLKNQEEARDAVQQIFLKTIVELHKYEVTYFSSWLYMIAKNHCLMMLRNKKFPSGPVDELEESPEIPEEPDFLKKESRLQQLELALKELSPEQNQCINLFYLQKKSYQEIASETGFTLLQVKSYIQNGKRNLRLLMEKGADKF